MKLLLIGALPPPSGGTTILFKLLVSELRRDPNFTTEVYDLPSLSQASTIHRVWILLTLSIRIMLQAHHYDAISVHVSSKGFVYLGAAISLIGKLGKKPIIMRAFGGDLKDIFESSSKITRILLSYSFNHSTVLLETQYLVKHFKSNFPYADINWFANYRQFPTLVTANFSQNAINFIYLGEVKKEKGILDLITAANLLNRNDFSIDIYGPITDPSITASDLKGNNISYKGIIAPTEVNQIISQHDMLILPTYYPGEGYPGVILEAYSQGIPVLASEWMAIPEIVKDGYTGYLSPPKNPQQLAVTIEKTLNSKKKLKEFSTNIKDFVNDFSSAIWTNKFKSIIKER